MSKLRAFSTYHIDRPGKMESELSEFASDSDVFFVEQPRRRPTIAHEQKLLLRNPVMWLTGHLLDQIWGILGFLLTLDYRPVDGHVTEVISQRHDIEIIPVDANLVKKASDVSLLVTVVSWLATGLALGLVSLGIMGASLSLISWGVLVAFVSIIPFALGTLSDRDETMARNIEEILKSRKDIQHGCLIVGAKHLQGISGELEQRDVSVARTHKSAFFRRKN